MLEEVTAKVQDVLKSCGDGAHGALRDARALREGGGGAPEEHTKNLATAEQDRFAALAGMSRKFKEDRTAVLEVERRRTGRKRQRDPTSKACRGSRVSEDTASRGRARSVLFITLIRNPPPMKYQEAATTPEGTGVLDERTLARHSKGSRRNASRYAPNYGPLRLPS